MKNKFYAYFQNLQDQICNGLEKVDGQAKFQEDIWEPPKGGGGLTRVIDNLIIPKLSTALSDEKKKNKVTNYLSALRIERKIVNTPDYFWEIV